MPIQRWPLWRTPQVTEFHQCRCQIKVHCQSINIFGLIEPFVEMTDEQRDAMSAIIGRTLPATSVAVLARIQREPGNTSTFSKQSPGGCPIVRKEDHDRFGIKLLFFEKTAQPPEVPIEVGNHPFKRGLLGRAPCVKIRLFPLLPDKIRTMRCVSSQVNKKWFVSTRIGQHTVDELHRLVKPHIGAIATERLPPITDQISVIKIIIPPVIRNLRYSTTAMPYGAFKPFVHRSGRRVVPQMPLTKHAGGIAIDRKQVAKRFLSFVQARSP